MVGMIAVAAMRADEGVTFAHPTQATARIGLASVAGVHLCYLHATFLSLVRHGFTQKTMLPQRETTTQGLASDGSLLGLRQTQVLEDQHGIGGGKVNKLLGSLPGKGARPAALLASKPFEKPTNTACVLLLCLMGRQFRLEAGAGFGGTTVLDLDGFAAHKQRLAIRIHGHQCIRFVEIDAHGQDTLGVRRRKRHRDPSDEPSIALKDIETINFDSLLERVLEVGRNLVGEAFAPGDHPDREGPILAKVSIPATLSYEEERTRPSEEEGAGSRFLVGFGALIGSSHCADSGNGHLSRERAFDLMIHLAL